MPICDRGRLVPQVDLTPSGVWVRHQLVPLAVRTIHYELAEPTQWSEWRLAGAVCSIGGTDHLRLR